MIRETSKAAEAFRAYCDLGPRRSLAKVAESLGKKSGYVRLLEKWSSDFNWVQRARDYDDEEAQERRWKREEAIATMNERHVLLAMEAQERASKQIEELIKAKAFGSVAAVQLLKLGIDAERLAMGAATERSELTGKDGAPLPASGANVTFWIPDNGRDGYAGRRVQADEEGEGEDARQEGAGG